MIVKIFVLCFTGVGLFAYIAALLNRKSELERLRKEIEENLKYDAKLSFLRKGVLLQIGGVCDRKISLLKKEIERLEKIQTRGVEKEAEEEFALREKEIDNAKQRIVKNKGCLSALREMEPVLNRDDVLKKAEVLCYFLKYKDLGNKLEGKENAAQGKFNIDEAEESRAEYYRKCASAYQEFNNIKCATEKEMVEFIKGFAKDISGLHLEDIAKKLFVLEEGEGDDRVNPFLYGVQTIDNLSKDNVELLSNSIVIGNVESFINGWLNLKKNVVDYKKQVAENIESLEKKVNNEEKIEKEKKNYIAKLNSELERLDGMKANLNTLSGTKKLIINRLESLGSRNYTQENFDREYGSVLYSLSKIIGEEETKKLQEKHLEIRKLYYSVNTPRIRYDNLNKNKNFYKPWILSENYD